MTHHIPFAQPRSQAAMDAWPPDDTEESILGISLHQMHREGDAEEELLRRSAELHHEQDRGSTSKITGARGRGGSPLEAPIGRAEWVVVSQGGAIGIPNRCLISYAPSTCALGRPSCSRRRSATLSSRVVPETRYLPAAGSTESPTDVRRDRGNSPSRCPTDDRGGDRSASLRPQPPAQGRRPPLACCPRRGPG